MFIAPVKQSDYGKLKEYNRLYSFPKLPEDTNGKIVIIDSGAYAFMNMGIEYSEKLVNKLLIHHNSFNNKDYILVAPDVPKNPVKTIKLFKYYKSISDNNIRPVFHFSKGSFDLLEFVKQHNFYKDYISDYIFMSDKKMRSPNRLDIDYAKSIVKIIRKYIGEKVRIHFLSCGKHLEDIRQLSKIENISFDTTIYQFVAKSSGLCSIWGVDYTDDYDVNIINVLNKINSMYGI
jgi:hypothetical protein